MDGIILINKEALMTSRDVVNQVAKKLKIKKVGHAGTLDPIATGLLIIGVGHGTKIMELLTLDTKEYIATVKMGIQTDTLDITGNIVEESSDFEVTKDKLIKVLETFKGKYFQTVPIYSAVKINGKKLYEYARNKENIELPKRLVEIFKIELLDYNMEQHEFKFKTLVSKGTYIRSLINDIGKSLKIPCTMKELVRTKSGKFKLEDSTKVDEEYKLIRIKDALDIKSIKVDNLELLKKIKNGNIVTLKEDSEYILFVDKDDLELAIYKNIKFNQFKAFKVF